ncbi:hypothetical protein [Psychrobacillus sp. NPDC096389]|uniref:hypothetical protein n=1 Tax=Psychrobacillus sp. NPDC096389 TaxID=3364490 RepID=UPI003802C17D
MRKVIIILKDEFSKELNEYQNLLNQYASNNYEINLFEDYTDKIKLNDFELIKSYFDVENFHDYDLVSDDHNLIFLWYRLYHNLFNEFILIFNKYIEPNFKELKKEEILLFSKIIKFDGISEEILKKKLYININKNNYFEIFDRFIKILYKLEIIDAINLKERNENKLYNKKYQISDGISYTFNYLNSNEYQIINLSGNEFSIIQHLSFDKLNKQSTSMDLLAWFVHYIQSIIKNNSKLLNIITIIYTENPQKNEEFSNKVISILKNIEPPFQDKLNLLFILLKLTKENEDIVNQLFILLKKDSDNIEIHHNVIINLFSAMFSNRIENKNEYYLLIRQAMMKISNFYKKSLEVKKNSVSNHNRIVITVDLLLNEMHSPTKVFIDFCNQLVRNTNFELLIIIEENFIPSKEEIFETALIIGNPSEDCKKIHENLLKDKRIKLFYSNTKETKVQRLKNINNTIKEFNPSVLLSYSTFSIIQNIQFNNIPIIYISFGNEYSLALANLYLYKNKLKALEIENSAICPVTSNIEAFINDFELLPKNKVFSRKDFNLEESDFVIITVGNRLQNEITENLVQEMQRFILKNNNVKWLLVSPELPLFLKKRYKELLKNNIIHITYESDLLALTSICDVYLNPKRIGGGYSIAAAMQEGVPILMTDFESDGLIIAGRENASGSSYEELILELEKMYEDSNYKYYKGEIFKAKMSNLSETSRFPELLVHINETLKKFQSI